MSSPATSSNSVSRCDFARLHRHSDNCEKREREENTSRVAVVTEPTSKTRCGGPPKTPKTPGRHRAILSVVRSPPPAHKRRSLRPQGQLPTPDPSQQHNPETEHDPNDTIVVSELAKPAIPATEDDHKHVIIGAEPSDLMQHQEQDPGEEAGNVFIAENSAESDDSNETMSNNPSNNASVARSSLGLTSILCDASLEEQPGLEVAEYQNPSSPFIRGSLDDEDPFINRPPVFTELVRRLKSARAESERERIHYTTHAILGPQHRDYEEEARRLRKSRAALRENLVASTTLIQTLQNRMAQGDGDETAIKALLTQARADLAAVQARDQVQSTFASFWRWMAIVFVIVIIGFTLWGWLHGPEMEYIRKRREEVLTE